MKLNKCPSCLKINYSTFCPLCITKLFNGEKVSHILPFSKPEYEKSVISQSVRISISGVQQKHSLKLQKGIPVITYKDGEFIIKPIPLKLMDNREDVPANEHLSMQIASQIFKINIPPNAIMFFKDTYEPFYIIKRFDRTPDCNKLNAEDFSQIIGKTEETDGADYKYNSSYEEIANKLKEVCPAYEIEKEKLFKVIIFNFLINNGDAHLKNFSILRNIEFGDYLLSPFYDILNTRLHYPQESELALELFKDSYESDNFRINAHYSGKDFLEFGKRIGIKTPKAKAIIKDFLKKFNEIENLTNRSFLSENSKKEYLKYISISIRKLNL